MNGIGLIIPEADFSGSPLGKVTMAVSPLELATQIVNDFVAVTHISNTQPIINLVVGLVENNLWDKLLAFFPMVGNSLESKLVDLKNPSRRAWNGANFSMSEKGIDIANNIDAGKPDSNLWYDSCPFVGFTISIAGYTRGSNSINVHSVYPKYFKDYGDGSNLFTINPNPLEASLQIKANNGRIVLGFGRNTSFVAPPDGIDALSVHRYTANISVGRRNLITDGELTFDEKNTQNYSPLNIYPILGVDGGNIAGDTLSINESDSYNSGLKIGSRALDGEIYALSWGNFNTIEQAILFDSLFGTFLNESGKV